MTNVRIGIQTRSIRQPLRLALRSAARLGADGVEIDARHELPPAELSQTGRRQFRKLLNDYGLRVSAVAFPTRRGYDTADDLERRVLATASAMRLAFDLGASVVVNRIGRVPPESDEQGFTRLVEALTAIGACGERVGTRLAAIAGGEAPAELARLLGALPEGAIGVDLHPVALIQGGYSPTDAVNTLGQHILHVHACDAVPGGGQAVDVELGRGVADMPTLLGTLEAQFNYRGWVTIESRGATNPVAAAENAVAYLRSL